MTTITTSAHGRSAYAPAPHRTMAPAMSRLRISPRAYRQVTLVAAILLALIIVTGAAVRLTGSGLGCPEWPNCTKGHLTAGASDDFHAKIEFANRIVTGLVSLGVIVAVLGSLVRLPRRRDLIWLSLGLVVGVIAQALLGALVVEELLDPPFVMGHFLLSAVLLADAIVLYHRAGIPDDMRSRPAVRARARSGWAACSCSRASVVLVTGTVVTGAGPHSGDAGEQREAQGHAARPRGARGRAHPRHERHGVPRRSRSITLWVVSRDPGGAPGDEAARRCCSSSSWRRARSATRSTSTACRRSSSGSTSRARPRCSAPRWPCSSSMYEPIRRRGGDAGRGERPNAGVAVAGGPAIGRARPESPARRRPGRRPQRLRVPGQ